MLFALFKQLLVSIRAVSARIVSIKAIRIYFTERERSYKTRGNRRAHVLGYQLAHKKRYTLR